MWTVSPATFSNGGGVLPTGPKVEPSSIRTWSRTLMVDWVAPVTSIVTLRSPRADHPTPAGARCFTPDRRRSWTIRPPSPIAAQARFQDLVNKGRVERLARIHCG